MARWLGEGNLPFLYSVSIALPLKRSLRFSRTTLSCLLLTPVYGTYLLGLTFDDWPLPC